MTTGPYRVDPVQYSRALATHQAREDDRNETWVRRFIEYGRLGPESRVIDVGCGVGAHLRTLADTCPYIVGLDRSSAMLSALRGCPGGKNVAVALADAQALPLPDKSVDATIYSHTLHQMADSRAALGEAYRVLRPGGVLLARAFTREQIETVDCLEYYLFPLTRELDRKTHQPADTWRKWLTGIGFSSPDLHEFIDVRVQSGDRWIQRFADRTSSTLHAMESYRYALGMVSARRELAGREEVRDERPVTLVVANK